ncbi:LOW QUALITY PROTEIN: hypothetical protein HID58_070973 [Brassica napus]|uniref:Uncharacterized protein n=1 Tax=Brassica napus TaxID=3708 RepID=A0ABQ7Z092_BRANA|nr:LOW QUALITY PROTEIN: hypothetical protein HID58_070973 [Brassica napus]
MFPRRPHCIPHPHPKSSFLEPHHFDFDSGGRRWLLIVGRHPNFLPLSKPQPRRAPICALPPSFITSGSSSDCGRIRRTKPVSGCLLRSDGEVVAGRISSGGVVGIVDLGFDSRWIWAIFTSEGSPDAQCVAVTVSLVSFAASHVLPCLFLPVLSLELPRRALRICDETQRLCWGLLFRVDSITTTMASDGFGSVWVFRDRSGFAVLWFCLCLHVTGLLHLLCLLMGAPPPPLLKRNLTTVHCLFVAKQPDSSVLCLYDRTGVEPYNLRFRQPVPHRCLIVGFFVSVWIIREWSCCSSGVSNVWSGLRRLRLPDQGLVSPASPVLLSESPSGRSAVPQTVLRLRTLLITSLVPVARLRCDLLILNGCSVFFHMPSFSLVFRDCG